MKLLETKGATSRIWEVFVADSSSTTGAGLAGLAYNSASLTAYYHRNTTGTATAITLANMTAGTFTSSGFKEIDATNMPGWYQFCPPNAALASGADSCSFHLKGATNMAPLPIEVQLTNLDLTDGVRAGLTALPNAAAAASGGLATVDTANSVKIQASTKIGVARDDFMFVMTDSDGNAATGLTVVATRSIDGAAFASCTNSVTEVSNGWYKIDLSTSDMNGTVIALRFSATGAADTDQVILNLT
jgi:hypothetical protein